MEQGAGAVEPKMLTKNNQVLSCCKLCKSYEVIIPQLSILVQTFWPSTPDYTLNLIQIYLLSG